MKTLSINEAIDLVPAIGAQKPNSNVSDRYQFVSTQQILEQVQTKGWLITNATAQGRTVHSQHRVTLVHENDLNNLSSNDEGVMRIELFNSHNRTKRLTFAIGFFRLVCSNGLIIASGPAETIRAKHSVFSNKHESLSQNVMERIHQLTDKFPNIIQKIDDLKSRDLTEEEQIGFAKFAIQGRYLYRQQLPKRFSDLEDSALKLLQTRRETDEGNSAWVVYNRVQENVIRGIPEFSQPIRSYSDNIRVNTLLWKGVDASLEHCNEKLRNTLQEFLSKKN
jgi:hypothetical protein